MNLFQYLALFVVVGLLVLTIIAMVRGWATRKEGIIWSFVWLLAAISIVRPGFTGAIAKILGIGRGADLVLYCAVVFMLVGFLMIYIRLRHLRRELTLVVRHMAISEAESQLDPPKS